MSTAIIYTYTKNMAGHRSAEKWYLAVSWLRLLNDTEWDDVGRRIWWLSTHPVRAAAFSQEVGRSLWSVQPILKNRKRNIERYSNIILSYNSNHSSLRPFYVTSAAQRSPLFQHAVSRDPRVVVSCKAFCKLRVCLVSLDKGVLMYPFGPPTRVTSNKHVVSVYFLVLWAKQGDGKWLATFTT